MNIPRIISTAVLVAVLAFGAYWYFSGAATVITEEPVFCTMDAKMCPDGSYVGRTGPKCEFAACPGSTSMSDGDTSGNTGGGSILPYNSGIRGVVMLGPMCPVMRDPPEAQCADKPYETLITIFRASDPVHAFVITKSDASGKFSASLPPGDYVIGAGEAMLPRCNHEQVTVGPNNYATTTISCDTGIR